MRLQMPTHLSSWSPCRTRRILERNVVLLLHVQRELDQCFSFLDISLAIRPLEMVETDLAQLGKFNQVDELEAGTNIPQIHFGGYCV